VTFTIGLKASRYTELPASRGNASSNGALINPF
jgi:hypothetical protein